VPITGILEVVSQCLYDTVQISEKPMSQDYHFFALPVGMHDHNAESGDYKQWLHTNTVQCGQLPAPCRFNAMRLNALFILEGNPLRIYETDLYAKTEIRFSVSQKSYWAGPAWLCASPFALFDTPKDELPRLREAYGIRWENIGANLGICHFKLGGPEEQYDGVQIGMQENFSVTARVYRETAAPALTLAIHLDGIEARSAQ
jgi:hypothetical protein